MTYTTCIDDRYDHDYDYDDMMMKNVLNDASNNNNTVIIIHMNSNNQSRVRVSE